MHHLNKWGWIWIYSALFTIAAIVMVFFVRPPEEESQQEKITLTFRHFWIKEHDRPVVGIFEDVVKEFQLEHPNVKVNFEGMDQNIHREQKLKSEMVTGTPPDLFVLFGGAEIEPYVRADRLLDLTDFAEEIGLTPQFKDLHLWRFDGRLYGLPIEGNAEPLYYNRAIFAELGLKEPQTLDELDEAVRKLRAAGYIPFALGNEDRWPAAIFAHYLMDRYAGPEEIEKLAAGSEGADFRNPGYMLAMDHLNRWARERAFSDYPNALSTEAAVSLFTNGRAAMYLNGNWDINLFTGEEAPPQFQSNVGVIPFPSLKAGEGRSIAGGYTIGIGLSSNLEGATREAALKLMQAFYTKEVQTRIVYEGLRIPSLSIAFDPRRTGPVFAQVLQMMEEGPASFVPYDNVLSPEVKKTLLGVLEKMIALETEPVAALNDLQAASLRYWSLIRSSADNEEEVEE